MKCWTINDFEIYQQLGRGKFGIVYRAIEKKSSMTVSVKMIAKVHLPTEKMRRQLRWQMEVHSRLKHPCICLLHGYFQDQHHIFLVMEYCEGGTLFTKIMQNRELLPEPEIARLLVQLLSAVAYLSSRCVMHRDIKLENVMMKDGQPKIIDFGWCVHSFHRRRTFCGTPEYLSPQMVIGSEYDSRIDVYTMGVLLYEMLFLRSPFYEEDEVDMMKNIREGVLLFEGERKEVSEEAKDLVQKMLTLNYLDRPKAIALLDHPFLQNKKLEEEAQAPPHLHLPFSDESRNNAELQESNPKEEQPSAIAEKMEECEPSLENPAQ